MILPVPGWDGSADDARRLQHALAPRLHLRDAFPRPPGTVAGFSHVLQPGDGAAPARVHACVALVDAGAQRLVAVEHASTDLAAGHAADEDVLQQHVATLLHALLARLPQAPELAFVEGHGTAHPRRCGLAAQFGLVADLPSIGVAGQARIGSSRTALHDMRGAFTPLRDEGEQIGWTLRSLPGAPPLVVSPGHRVAMAAAPEQVMHWVAADRWPEPLRLSRRHLRDVAGRP